MKRNTGEKLTCTYLAAILVILVFTIASVASIMWMESKNTLTFEHDTAASKVHTLENDTAWLESYFTESRELSAKQKEIIRNSASIISDVAQNAGVTVTLKSICGNSNSIYCKVDVELSEKMSGKQVLYFEGFQLDTNDNPSDLQFLTSRQFMVPDENPKDNRYSCFLFLGQKYNSGRHYVGKHGMPQALHLKNVMIQDGNTQQGRIEGQWEFSILVPDDGKAVELIRKPVVIKGGVGSDKSYFEPKITSFVLTEFAAFCQYKKSPDFQVSVISLSPVIILKDGRTVRTVSASDSHSGECYYELETPIVLNEVAFVKLTDEIELAFPNKKF